MLRDSNEKPIKPIQGQCVLYRDEINCNLKRCRVISKDAKILECMDSGETLQPLELSIFEFPRFGKDRFPALAIFVKFASISKFKKNAELVFFIFTLLTEISIN